MSKPKTCVDDGAEEQNVILPCSRVKRHCESHVIYHCLPQYLCVRTTQVINGKLYSVSDDGLSLIHI